MQWSWKIPPGMSTNVNIIPDIKIDFNANPLPSPHHLPYAFWLYISGTVKFICSIYLLELVTENGI